MKYTALILLIFCQTVISGPIDNFKFDNLSQEQRYFKLTKELRCLKCQNSSIAGSNAVGASTLRAKVHKQITQQNMSNQEIKQWMLDRYGDFILYQPQLKFETILLWGLPLLLSLIGFILLIRLLLIKKHVKPEELSAEQINKLNRILNK